MPRKGIPSRCLYGTALARRSSDRSGPEWRVPVIRPTSWPRRNPGSAGFDVLLIAHVGRRAVSASGRWRRAASRRRPNSAQWSGRRAAAGALRPATSRPGANWAGRVLYGVPVFGFALLADSHGRAIGPRRRLGDWPGWLLWVAGRRGRRGAAVAGRAAGPGAVGTLADAARVRPFRDAAPGLRGQSVASGAAAGGRLRGADRGDGGPALTAAGGQADRPGDRRRCAQGAGPPRGGPPGPGRASSPSSSADQSTDLVGRPAARTRATRPSSSSAARIVQVGAEGRRPAGAAATPPGPGWRRRSTPRSTPRRRGGPKEGRRCSGRRRRRC